jgi:AcrR family transcriptional regulator
VEVRREEILDAAVREITGRGVAATRVADVARALSVSPALVFYHFKTKDQLLAAAFEYAAQRDLDRLAHVLARKGSARVRLAAVLRLYQPSGASPSWALWVDGWAAALHSADLRRASRRLDLRWKDAIVGLIGEGVAAGEFDCPDPRAAAWRITALIDGLSVQLTVHRGAISRRHAADLTRQQAARELGLDAAALS